MLAAGGLVAFVTVRGNVLAPEAHPVAEPNCDWPCGTTTPPFDPGHVHTHESPATGPAAGPSPEN